jgi:hypothetical protein
MSVSTSNDNNPVAIAKKQVWQAQACSDPVAWESSIHALKTAEKSAGEIIPHIALYESLQALFYNPSLRKTAAHLLLHIADELKADAHKQAIRAVVGYYFEVRELEYLPNHVISTGAIAQWRDLNSDFSTALAKPRFGRNDNTIW